MGDLIAIEVVAAQPHAQQAVALQVKPGTTLRQAVEQSGLDPAQGFGVFGKTRDPETAVAEGDRIEIYRSLIKDPKQARRQRAGSRA